jgi:hypothetical protein
MLDYPAGSSSREQPAALHEYPDIIQHMEIFTAISIDARFVYGLWVFFFLFGSLCLGKDEPDQN